jgi:DNA gyrase/topoisomerase IV subunit B
MPAKTLAETTMNPRNRTLLKVNINSALEADKTFTALLGKDPSERYKFIMEEAAEVEMEELDV